MIADSHPKRLFSVPFHSAMDERDVHRLRAELGMTMDFHPALAPGTTSAGAARLDFFSGLFLIRGRDDGDWRLECRSTRPPSPVIVHRWAVEAAAVAHELDPAVAIPPSVAA